MALDIKTITLDLPYRLGRVNCYLIHTSAGFILIDTGSSNQRAVLVWELQSAGCQPGNLKLIFLTHGDFDHTGNAAYLRQTFGAPLAMHPADFGMLERGDMFASRSSGNPILKALAPLLFRFGAANRATPDVQLTDGDDLSNFGLAANVIALPGHSRGSIGLLTVDGDLFVGDLLDNTKQPALNSIMDDRAAAQTSVEKLKALHVVTVHPGHGAAFPMNHLQILTNH